MKVGLVLDDTLDTNDGVQQYVLMLGAWLSDHKHEVHYLVGKTKRSDLARLHSLSKNIKVRFNRNRLSIPLPVSSRKIKKLLKKEAFDVLHVQTPYSPQLGGKIIRYADARTAVIATFHILPFSATERIGSSFLAKVQRKSLRRIDMMVSVSEPARKFAHKYFGVDSVVIPNPVNIAKLSSGNHLEEFREKQLVVYLGRLVERKGILQFLRVVRKIKTDLSLTNAHVVIVGSGPLKARVEQYIHQHKLDEIVQCVGHVSESEKSDYLKSASVAVFPSLGGESFGIVLTEAMAAGAGVVIAGDNPGYRSVLQSSAALFDPTDTDQFAALLQHLLTNDTLKNKLHKMQQQLVKQFDIDVVGPQILDIYRQSIAKRVKDRNNSNHEVI